MNHKNKIPSFGGILKVDKSKGSTLNL